MRNRFKSTAREIIVPFPLDIELENVSITVPQRGDKKKLVELSEMNVKQYKVDKLKQAEKLNPEQRSTRLLKRYRRRSISPNYRLISSVSTIPIYREATR